MFCIRCSFIYFECAYILMSIFAGFLSDRWNKKITMLVCDTLAIFSTGAIFILSIALCLILGEIMNRYKFVED